jgi:subtilisin family serine protease
VNNLHGYGQSQDSYGRWSAANSVSVAQFEAIRKAASEDSVNLDFTSFRTDGPPLYIWLRDHVLLRGDFNHLKNNDDLVALGAVVADQPGGPKDRKQPRPVRDDLVTLLKLENKTNEPTEGIVKRLNSEGELKDRISHANLAYVTHPDGANLCPADEPTPLRRHDLTVPYPPASRNAAAGRGVRITVIDTGLSGYESGQWKVDHPWLDDGVDGEGEPGTYDADTGFIAPHAGHGLFIAGLIRCVAPGATVQVKNTMRWCGAMDEHKVALTIMEALDSDPPPDIISFSAGYMVGDKSGAGPAAMLDVMNRLKGDDCRTVLVAATGNDGHGPLDDGLFFPAAFAANDEFAEFLVAVGALRQDRQGRACFSNYGDWVTVYEEGEKLINAFPKGRYSYHEPVSKEVPPLCTYYPSAQLEQGCTCVTAPGQQSVALFDGMAAWSGTSFATPIVAGRIARHMTENRRLPGPREATQDLLKQRVLLEDTGDGFKLMVFPEPPIF